MVSVHEEKRVIFGWMVDYMCWDGLNDFLLTLNTNAIVRTHDLLNGCLASSTSTLMDEVPYRRHMADLISFLTKICSGNNHRLNAKRKKTILETALSELQQLKNEVLGFEDLEFKLMMHAVIICCTDGNFVLASEVYERLDLKSFIRSPLISESDRELLHTVRDILTNKNIHHEFLKNYSYKSFISMWVPLFQDIFKNMREPHLVEMCRGMIGNNKLIAIGADSSKIRSDRFTNNSQTGGKMLTDCFHRMSNAVHNLNLMSDFSDSFKSWKPKPVSSNFTVIKVEEKDDLNSVTGEDSDCSDEAVENQNSGPSNLAMLTRECRVMCVPLERDTNLTLPLRNLGIKNNSENVCSHTSVSEEAEIQNEQIEFCEDDEKQNEEAELREDEPLYLNISFSEDDEIQNDGTELDENIEAAVARICGEELPSDGEPRENVASRVKETFSSLQTMDSSTINEETPVRKIPKLDLTLGSRLSKRTTLTPVRKNPLKIPEEKKKVSWTSKEEDDLYYGIRVYGEGNWERIRCHFNLMHRNGGNLSDKWRNLKKNPVKIQVLKKRYMQKLKEQTKTNKAGDSPVY